MSANNNNQIKNNNPAQQTGSQKQKIKKDNGYLGYRKNARNEFSKKSSQRYNSESIVSRIANPKREETIEDIKMDIEKLEKEIQFEIKQIRSIKLGL